MAKRIVLFLVLNFLTLALGGLFTGDGVSSDWYAALNKAPWTPPGWVFGAAWTTIMVCYALYMALLFPIARVRSRLLGLYAVQLLLNFAWNPTFFHFRMVGTAMLVITLLTLLIVFKTVLYRKHMRLGNVLILPYLLWLLIATSLNAYILFEN